MTVTEEAKVLNPPKRKGENRDISKRCGQNNSGGTAILKWESRESQTRRWNIHWREGKKKKKHQWPKLGFYL